MMYVDFIVIGSLIDCSYCHDPAVVADDVSYYYYDAVLVVVFQISSQDEESHVSSL